MGSKGKVKNLQNTIRQTIEKLLQSKAKAPWKPTKANDIESNVDVVAERVMNREEEIVEKKFASYLEGI